MRKMTAVQLIRQIKASQARIAKERDKLRDLVEEAQEIVDCCVEADDGLTQALDALSQYL